MMTTPDSDSSTVLAALGAVIGYVGSEIATDDLFERLLWPQRFWNGFSARNAVAIAALMPMGGPLHKAALQTIDKFFKYGLFKGDRMGHMLGTVFFRDNDLRFSRNGLEDGEKEDVRNGLWVRALAQIPMPAALLRKKPQQEDGVNFSRRSIRQRISVAHLTVSYAGLCQPSSPHMIIRNDTGPVSFKSLAALFMSEASAIAVSIVVAVIWRSYFMVLWLVPLLLKLLCALFAVSREGLLISPEKNNAYQKGLEEKNPPMETFVVHLPGHGFQVIEGEGSLVLQFFRHYGHPIRHRSREVIQISIIFAFGIVFPVGLLSSIVWMPTGLQYMWLGYQLYATTAMHIYRYMGGHQLATTEEMIAMAFTKAERENYGEFCLFLSDGRKTSVMARLNTTYHDGFAEGRDHVGKLLRREGQQAGALPEGAALPNSVVLPP